MAFIKLQSATYRKLERKLIFQPLASSRPLVLDVIVDLVSTNHNLFLIALNREIENCKYLGVFVDNLTILQDG